MQNWEQYQAAYQAADQTTKDKLHSSLISECVDESVKKYELDTSHRKILMQLFASKVAGIMDTAGTTEAMRTAGIPAATVISKEIDECIATKTPTIPDTSLVEEGETSEVTKQSVEVTPPEFTPDTLAVELAETEAAFKQLQPIRTMAHDMETIKQDEPVHQATSQESILNGQGNAQKNTSAQWGTPEK